MYLPKETKHQVYNRLMNEWFDYGTSEGNCYGYCFAYRLGLATKKETKRLIKVESRGTKQPVGVKVLVGYLVDNKKCL